MASHRPPDLHRLDVAAFAAAKGELSGEWSVAELRRLASAAFEPSQAPVRWRAEGARLPLPGAGTFPSLSVEADTSVTLECQRCLQPMPWPLHAQRRLFFVEGEDAAASLDADHDDDVLALTPALDLWALVEDELLLALPIVPRHEVCPAPLPRALLDDDAEAAPEDNPFAALAALRRGPAPN